MLDYESLNRERKSDVLWWMLEAVRISWWGDYLGRTSSVVTTGSFSL